MSEKTQPAILNFVKIRSWFVPADAETYQKLKELNTPLVKLHQDFIPTLSLVLKPRGIRAKSIPFRDIFNARMDKIGTIWKSQPERRCTIDENRAVFTCKTTEKNKKSISELDILFSKFCSRWGMRYSPVYSEANGRSKLVVDYKFDPDLNPCVPTSIPEDKTSFEFVLGFTKITLSFHQKGRGGVPYNHIKISTRTGNEWLQVYTGSFTNKEIGDIRPWLSAMGILHSQFKIEE